jgi:hypothetical protein
MSLLTEFDSAITKIDVACMAAVEGGIRDALLKKIEEKAKDNVYSYGASARAMAERRGTIGTKGVMEIEAGGGAGEFWLVVTNRAFTQNPAPAEESDIVEEGYANYNQPGPRLFMQVAADELMESGEVDAILQQYLSMYGL